MDMHLNNLMVLLQYQHQVVVVSVLVINNIMNNNLKHTIMDRELNPGWHHHQNMSHLHQIHKIR